MSRDAQILRIEDRLDEVCAEVAALKARLQIIQGLVFSSVVLTISVLVQQLIRG